MFLKRFLASAGILSSLFFMSCLDSPTSSDPDFIYWVVNDTWVNVAVFINGGYKGTVAYKDSMFLVNNADGSTRYRFVQVETMAATDNNLVWRDTIQPGQNYRTRYQMSSNHYLLRISNGMNLPTSYCVVEGGGEYDSSAVTINSGSALDVGFYPTSYSAKVRLYFTGTTEYLSWNNVSVNGGAVTTLTAE
jgi:hypothetical protein